MVSSSRNMSRQELFAMAKEEAFGDRDGECPICMECPYDEPLQTPCRHIFCKECIVGYLQTKPECPMCRAKTTVPQLKQLMDPDQKKKEQSDDAKNDDNAGNGDHAETDNIRFDSKMMWI